MINRTSCSDNEKYPEFCYSASKNEDLFRNFRSNEIYTGIVETLNRDEGKQYLEMFLKKSPSFVKYLKKFQKSDLVGNPVQYSYKKPYKFPYIKSSFKIAPTTLRYIKVLSDLNIFFGNLDGLVITEIGGGYGGQFKIISDIFKPQKYVIYDLPGPLKLTKKFLDKFKIQNYELKTIDELKSEISDLVISNYSFSELNGDLQMIYYDHIINNAKGGYLTCNFSTHTYEGNQFTKEILIEKLNKEVKVLNNSNFLPKVDTDSKIDLIVFK